MLRKNIQKKTVVIALAGAKAKAARMYFFDMRHNIKKDSSSKNTFHYLTRTAHFEKHKEFEKVEYVKSGNLPIWAKNRPADFWGSADKFEIERGRTATVLTIALPKELSVKERAELVENFIENFTSEHKFPFTAAVHNHESTLTGEDQPHLHLMYSERSLSDKIQRPAEQFFKQYRPKNPIVGGAPKMTANALGQGKSQVKIFRELTEQIINEHLFQYAPAKTLVINGLEIEVKNEVSCLSNRDYNKKHGTSLQDVPQIERWKLHSSDPIIQLEVQARKETIRKIRTENTLNLYEKEYQQQAQARLEAQQQAQARLEAQQQAQARLEAQQQVQARLEAQQQAQARLEAQQQVQARLEAQQQAQARLEAQQQAQARLEAQQQVQAQLEAQQQAQEKQLLMTGSHAELAEKIDHKFHNLQQFAILCDDKFKLVNDFYENSLARRKVNLPDLEKFYGDYLDALSTKNDFFKSRLENYDLNLNNNEINNLMNMFKNDEIKVASFSEKFHQFEETLKERMQFDLAEKKNNFEQITNAAKEIIESDKYSNKTSEVEPELQNLSNDFNFRP